MSGRARLTAVAPGGAGAGEGQRAELPSRLGAAPRRALCRRQPAAFVAPAEPAVGAMLPAPPHSCLSAPHRAVPAAPRSGSQPVGIPALPSPSCCCSDLIPPLVGFLAAVLISLPFSPSCQPQFPCSVDISWWCCYFSGDVVGRQTPQMFQGKQARDEGDLQRGKKYWKKIR